MKMSCRVSNVKTFYLELNQAEADRLVRIMELIDPHNLALQVACQDGRYFTPTTDVNGTETLVTTVEDATDALYHYGAMISLIDELKFLRRM